MLFASPGLLASAASFEDCQKPVDLCRRGVHSRGSLIERVLRSYQLRCFVMAAFAFVNGWVDAISLHRYKAFATMMVGNMLMLGNSAVEFAVLGTDDPTIFWLPDPVFYLLLMLVFTSSTAVYRVLSDRGWSSKRFAVIALIWITLHDVVENIERSVSGLQDHEKPNRWNVLRLTPMFAVQDAMAVQNGMGALPWCTTGQVVTVGYTLPDLLAGKGSAKDMEKFRMALLMMISTILGSVAGAAFDMINEPADWEYTVVTPLIFALLWLYDPVFKPPPPKPVNGDSSSAALLSAPL